MRRGLTPLCAVLGALAACGGGSPGGAGGDWLAEEGASVYPLGWLGGRAHPAPRSVQVPDPDSRGGTTVAGGMVVTQVTPDAPLAVAGVGRGDVIVGVAGAWLPNKEDPSLDLMRAIEDQVSSGADALELGVLRSGALDTVRLSPGLAPLEVGLPGPSERLEDMVRAGLRRLVALQADDGSFPGATGADAQVATCSLAGLALLAGGAGEGGNAPALARCRARVEAAVDDLSSELGPWGTALATMFLAELAGPLELGASAFITTAGVRPAALELPEGMPSGAIVIGGQGGELPEYPAEMLEKLGESGGLAEGAVQFTVVGPPGATQVAHPPGATPEAGEAPSEGGTDGPLWTLEQLGQLGQLGGEELGQRLGPLIAAVERLVALQRESGGWDPEDPQESEATEGSEGSEGSEDSEGPGDAGDTGEGSIAFSDATLATNQALLALGMAERVGAPVAGEVLRRGLAFVRQRTNDGHVFSVDVPGFDRRREAGRANGAAAALLALNCRRTDPFLRELTDYGDRHGPTIPGARAGVPLHVLNTAVLARQRGLDAWAVFFEEFRHLLVSVQEPDGSFAPYPHDPAADPAAELALDALCAGEAGRTALWTLVAALQSDRLPVLGASARNPLQTTMTSAGVRVASGFAAHVPAPVQLEGGEWKHVLEAAGVDPEQVIRKAAGGDDDGDD